MSTSSPNWSLEFMNNPLNIQQRMLDRFEEYAGGDYIVDPNNVVSFSMEMFAELTADATSEMDKKMQSIYPSRSQNTSDLYKHMSDYDYIHLFSSPASATIQVSLDKTYLMKHALDVPGTSYKKVVIPKTTKITIGTHSFGLYYPVEIRINPASETFSVVYDTTVVNPLYPVQNNVLEHSFRQYDNLKLLYIQLPVWQFETKVHREELIAGTGFTKTFSYNDKFYAIRCFAETYETDEGADTPTWAERELSLSLNNQTYDHTNPTAVFTILPETKECKVHIPYVYFTEDRIRGLLRIEIYTTAGSLNYVIPTNTTEYCAMGFFTEDISAEEAMYAEPLRTIPAIAAVPLNTVIKGGTNGMTYDELRDCVINDTFSDKPLQTPDDVDAYWKKRKYVTTLYRDGITDRVFISHAKLTDASGAVIGAATISTQINLDKLSEYGTIHANDAMEDTYTILPSTIYKFDEASGTCIPLTTREMVDLEAMSPFDKVNAYNTNSYTISPYHLQICTKGKYPTTITYDLRDTAVIQREFIGENKSTASQLTLFTAKFAHAMKESKYTLDMVVSRTDDLKDIDVQIEETGPNGETMVAAENFIVVVVADTIYDKKIYAKSTFLSRESDLDIYTLNIPTEYDLYQIDNRHGLGIKNVFKDDDGSVDHIVSLDSNFTILLCAKRNIISESEYQETYVETALPSEYNEYAVLSEQKIVVRLGSVIHELDQRMSLSYDKAEYDTYKTTRFNTLDYPIYRRDNNGAIEYTIDAATGEVRLNELYGAGTITMITEDTEKEITFNEDNVRDYINHVFKYQSNAGVSEEITITNDNASGLVGKTGYVTIPRTPRFTITGAYSPTSEDSPVLGTYDSAAPAMLGALSSSADMWNKDNIYVDTTSSSISTDKYRIRAVDALLVALRLATSSIDGILTTPTALPKVGREGVFVFVTNDAVGTDSGQSSMTNPHYGYIKSSSSVEDKECPARLYTWADGHWVSLIGCESLDTVRRIIKSRNGTVTTADDDNVEHTSHPVFYGYAYILEIIEDSTKTPIDRIDDVDGLGDLLHVAWLTKSTLSSSSAVEYPDFSECQTVVTEVDSNDNEVIIDTDVYWKNNVNQWPWDVKDWCRIRSIVLYADETNTNVMNMNQVSLDETFGISFDAQGSSKFCQYITGQLILDEYGQPRATKSRNIVYLIDMLQMDAKLAISNVTEYADYPDSVCEQMSGYFDDIGEAKPKLFPNSRIFFEPLKSFGSSMFIVNGVQKQLPLDITMGFRLYVNKSAAEDLNLLDTLKEQVTVIIDNKLSEGIVNCSDIAKEIATTISDSVQHVDVLGINGDQDLQTMTCNDTNIRPHLKHMLKLLDDGTTIDVERGLTIEIVVVD